MSRRSVALCLLAVMALVLALIPWEISSDRLRSAVARQIRNEFGLELGMQGRATLVFLPVPRLKIQGVTLADEAGAFSAVGQFNGDLRLLSFLTARVRFSDVRIVRARIQVALDGAGRNAWTAGLDRLRERLTGGDPGPSRVDRIIVTDSELALVHPGDGQVTEWRRLNATIRWPEAGGDVDLSASGLWKGELVSVALSGLTPSLLLGGASDRLDIRATSRLGRVNLLGSVTLGPTPHYAGLLAIQTPSLGSLARWTGLGLDLQDLDQPAGLSGDARLDSAGVEWPKAVLDLGRDRLDGSLAYRVDGERPKLRATLAGGDLDLGWVMPVANPTRATAPRGDYDVRLSASGMRMGDLRLGDLAAGILVSGERLEVSVARATLAGGSVKGRLSAALDGEGRDMRGQVSIDKVDLESLLSKTAPGRGISGTIGGQATFEALGESQADLSRHLRGRVMLVARDGEISGIALNEAAKRVDVRRAAGATPDWRGGRTRFGEAQLHLNFADGVAEITDGRVQTITTQTRVRGRISLSDGALALQATTRLVDPPATERPFLVLDVRGPIEKPVVSSRAPEDVTGATDIRH
ncbi:AsmA family protein [uncultured Enterovirga sp.]|uniref:AsmA family protein n=1 Tax=uncultured Enterovirga sp. TaxID=2026352 RepID=UPI0035CB538B